MTFTKSELIDIILGLTDALQGQAENDHRLYASLLGLIAAFAKELQKVGKGSVELT